MKYDLVIFDLDGTLLDTLDDLANAANRALTEAGYPARTREEVRRFIGNGVAALIRQALPEAADDDAHARVLQRFKAIYMDAVNVKTHPYPGIIDMLALLRKKGIRAAVNSNKVDGAVQLLCNAHFGGLIDLSLGERPSIPKKPDPEGARRIMRELGASPERTLYVGDGEADIMTARRAGIDCAWVSWGFRRAEELIGLDIPRAFDTVPALTEYLLSE